MKAGMVKKIRNDMYTCVNGENGMAVANRFQIGSSINDGACISHHTAMEYYGITDQVFYDVYVTSEKTFNSFEFEGYRYHRLLPSLSKGIKKEEYSGGVVVTDKERTVLDSIKDMDKITGAEEVISNLESVGILQELKMLLYLEEYDNQFLYQKTGFLLSNLSEAHGLSESFFEICKRKTGQGPVCGVIISCIADSCGRGTYSLCAAASCICEQIHASGLWVLLAFSSHHGCP